MPKKKVEMKHPMAGKSKKAKRLVDDAQDIFDELDKKEAEEKERAQKESEPIPEKKLKGLKQLLFMGYSSKDVEIGGFVFTLNTLTHEQSRKIAKKIVLLNNEEKLIDSNILYVAESLSEINGLDISDAFVEIFESDPLETDFDMALEILSNMNMHVSAKLMQEYYDLSGKSREMLSLDDKGKDLKK